MTMQHRGDLITAAIVLILAYFGLLWTCTGWLAEVKGTRTATTAVMPRIVTPAPQPAPPGQTIRMTIAAPRVPVESWNQRQFARSR